MEVASTGSTLFTRVKAPYVNRVIPEGLYRYLLMARTRVVSQYEPVSGRARFEAMIKQKAEDAYFGHVSGKKLRDMIEKRITLVEVENMRLKREVERTQDVRDALVEIGLDPAERSTWAVRDAHDTWKGKIPAHLVVNLKHMASDINQLLTNLERKGICEPSSPAPEA